MHVIGLLHFCATATSLYVYRELSVAYKLLHLTVVHFRGRETPMVRQAEIRWSVKERIHLGHTVQTGQGLQRVTQRLLKDIEIDHHQI